MKPTGTVLMSKWGDIVEMGPPPQHPKAICGTNEQGLITSPVLEAKRRFVKSISDKVGDESFSGEIDQVLAALFDSREEGVSEEEFQRQMRTVFVPKDSSLGPVPRLNPFVHSSLVSDGCKLLRNWFMSFVYGIQL